MAKVLREVGPAVGVLSKAVLAGTDEQRFSVRYGGDSVDVSPADAVYIGVGRTITISGRYCSHHALVLQQWRPAAALVYRLLTPRAKSVVNHGWWPTVPINGGGQIGLNQRQPKTQDTVRIALYECVRAFRSPKSVRSEGRVIFTGRSTSQAFAGVAGAST